MWHACVLLHLAMATCCKLLQVSGCAYLQWQFLIGSFDCLDLFWLARVITVVLVLRQYYITRVLMLFFPRRKFSLPTLFLICMSSSPWSSQSLTEKSATHTKYVQVRGFFFRQTDTRTVFLPTLYWCNIYHLFSFYYYFELYYYLFFSRQFLTGSHRDLECQLILWRIFSNIFPKQSCQRKLSKQWKTGNLSRFILWTTLTDSCARRFHVRTGNVC